MEATASFLLRFCVYQNHGAINGCLSPPRFLAPTPWQGQRQLALAALFWHQVKGTPPLHLPSCGRSIGGQNKTWPPFTFWHKRGKEPGLPSTVKARRCLQYIFRAVAFSMVLKRPRSFRSFRMGGEVKLCSFLGYGRYQKAKTVGRYRKHRTKSKNKHRTTENRNQQRMQENQRTGRAI